MSSNPTTTATATATCNHLTALMSRYTTAHLCDGYTPTIFEQRIRGLVGIDDSAIEGYNTDDSRQRDQSVRFTWGHDHDFGTFRMPGLMRDRHIRIIAEFVDRDLLPINLTGKRVLDIGCWTGGTSLLLSAMGAEVTAIEEVVKYAECVRLLASAFDTTIEVRALSLYDLPYNTAHPYDYVLLSGVLYHITDPVLALRLTFNALSDGGRLLIETEAHPGEDKIIRYAGPSRATVGGTAKQRNRQGWNWLIPTVPTLVQMLTDVGYTTPTPGQSWMVKHRAYVAADRARYVDMLRAGLSNRGIG